MEKLQENSKDYKTSIFWWQYSRNCIKKLPTIRPYELGQEKETAGH